ncbi:hypothetical protein D3C76_1243930 [compost metagenome]
MSVFPQIEQYLQRLETSQHLACTGRQLLDIGAGNLMRHPAGATEHIDCREMTAGGQLATQVDMPVEDGANLLGNGVSFIVAFHQYGVERGNAPVGGHARTFQQTRQGVEHRSGITAPRGCFPRRQREVAAGAGITAHGVKHQHHLPALITEILSDCRCL